MSSPPEEPHDSQTSAEFNENYDDLLEKYIALLEKYTHLDEAFVEIETAKNGPEYVYAEAENEIRELQETICRMESNQEQSGEDPYSLKDTIREHEATIRQREATIRGLRMDPDETSIINQLLSEQDRLKEEFDSEQNAHVQVVQGYEEQSRGDKEQIGILQARVSEQDETLQMYRESFENVHRSGRRIVEDEPVRATVDADMDQASDNDNDATCSVPEHKHFVRTIHIRNSEIASLKRDIEDLEGRLSDSSSRDVDAPSDEPDDHERNARAQTRALRNTIWGLRNELRELNEKYDKSKYKLQHCGEHRQKLQNEVKKNKDHFEYLNQRLDEKEKGQGTGDCESRCKKLERQVHFLTENNEWYRKYFRSMMEGVDPRGTGVVKPNSKDADGDDVGGDGDENRRGG
ncbi:hypothetical protein N0V83_003296 [Neocucurbitaria cava]|uniref:Uncharacterized protein n=1 Tax=Neocucurbitaria cava TaxID=798079 RepID=A0A9W9CP57_9PLEO|nr:hypothetical protein N0V83_003296 [Neocucurbitaria cava]